MKKYSYLSIIAKGKNKTKEKVFLDHIDAVITLLEGDTNMVEQAKSLSNTAKETISKSSYIAYCKKYIPDVYNEYIINISFNFNADWIIINLEKNKGISSFQLYKILLKDKRLLIRNAKNRDSLSYEIFLLKLKEFLKNIPYSIKTYEKPEDMGKLEESPRAKRKTVGNTKSNIVESTAVLDSPNKEKGSSFVELLDGTINKYSNKYLKIAYIVKDGMPHDFCFNEKNRLCTHRHKQKIDYNWEDIKANILKSDSLPDNTLIFFNNAREDNKIYIYRYMKKEVIFIEEMSSLYYTDNLEYFSEGFNWKDYVN